MHRLLDTGICGTWQDTRKTDVTDSRIYIGMQQYVGKERRVAFLGNYELFYDINWTKDCAMTPVNQRIGGRRTPYRWTGDMAFKTWEDLAYQIKGITNIHGALKGISYLTNDCMRLSSREISVRSCQFLCFNSVLRSHHPKPWETGSDADDLTERMAIGKERKETMATVYDGIGADNEDKEQEAILRKFIELRYRLFPYIYTVARQTYDTGLPMTRPLMIAFENDAHCNANQYPYEYMLGERLLVCPVWHGGKNMEIYLPSGCDWVDFFTGETYSGGEKISADVTDLHKMPIYVRAGSIIPFGANKYWLDDADPSLTLAIFGSGEDSFDLYEDDGISLGYQENAYAVTRIVAASAEDTVRLTVYKPQGKYKGMPKERKITVYYKGNKQTETVASDSGKEFHITVKREGAL